DLAVIDLSLHCRREVDLHLYVIPQQRHHDVGRILVRDNLHIETGHRLEQLSAEVLRTADRDRTDVELARLCFRRFDEIGERLVFGLAIDDENKIEGPDHRDRLKIFYRIEGKALERRDTYRRAVCHQRHRVTVRRRGDHRARSVDATRARHVLDDDTLAKLLAKLVRHDA